MVFGGHLHAKGAVRDLEKINGSKKQEKGKKNIAKLKPLKTRIRREPRSHHIPLWDPPDDHKKNCNEYSANQQIGTPAPPASSGIIRKVADKRIRKGIP